MVSSVDLTGAVLPVVAFWHSWLSAVATVTLTCPQPVDYWTVVKTLTSADNTACGRPNRCTLLPTLQEGQLRFRLNAAGTATVVHRRLEIREADCCPLRCRRGLAKSGPVEPADWLRGRAGPRRYFCEAFDTVDWSITGRWPRVVDTVPRPTKAVPFL